MNTKIAAAPPPIAPAPFPSTARNALVVISVVAAGCALYWLRGILAPLALAVFLLFTIDGLARGLHRWLPIIPQKSAVPTALVLTLLAFGASIWVMKDGFAGFAGQLSGINGRVDAIIADITNLLHLKVAPTTDQLLKQIDIQSQVKLIANGVQGIAADAFFVLVYLGFLLASRNNFNKKIVALFPNRGGRREATHILERIRDGVEGYVWVQTVTGVMIAFASWVVMMLVGLDNALFWAFVIFLLSYIPIIGGLIAGLGPPLFALVQFQTYWQAIVLVIAIQAILFVVGNIILPRMQAESQNVDPVVVLLSLAFWGALWGVTGAFLSTPLTVMAMAILAEFDGSRWVAIMLSGDGDPYPAEVVELDPK
jgi:AI-2 transport protein TqsA